MAEVWRPVVGYEGLYEVSDHGRVRGPKGLVKPKPTNRGYIRTELWRNGSRWRPSIHRLVAEHFIANPKQHPQVNHKDGDKSNNAVTNLEWCTASENALHAVQLHGRYGQNNPASKISEREAIAISVMLEKGVPGNWLANLFGITNAQISNIRKGHQWKYINSST